MSDFVQLKSKKLFYGVFNTPEYTPTGTAICFFDINDIERVFQLDNFDYDMGEEIQNYKFDATFQIQNCPSLAGITISLIVFNLGIGNMVIW